VSGPGEGSRPLALSRRLAGVAGAALLGFLGSPGNAGPDGSLALAVLGVALWAWTVLHPLGPRPVKALACEWAGGALAGGAMMWWVSYVTGPDTLYLGVLYIGAGWGVYAAGMGALLRLLARRFPLPLAAGLAWTGVELVRALVPPPFGLGWFRLGYYAHAHLWLSGSARVIGLEGLTFVLAALGGGIAALARARRARQPDLACALAPLALAALLAGLVPAPAAVDGPRVLLVQPGFPQRRKQHGDERENLAFSRDLTHRAVAEAGPADLVCWGESMLYVPLFSDEVEAAVRTGSVRAMPWDEAPTPKALETCRANERFLVQRELMAIGAKERPFPAGASFAAGAEYYDLVDGWLRRKVALVLFDQSGGRSAPAFKQHLVPLGETFFGLERFAWVRALAHSAAGYLPDLVPGSATGVPELRGRDGRSYRLSATVCFDNAHPWPYLEAVRGGPVDFHLVVSNEAWYETSCEMDQMVAFSRVFALMTARAFVRATNSGVSLVLGPDGRELGRVRDPEGRDRAVAGFGAWTVPVPAPGSASTTPYVAWGRFSEALWLALVALAGLFAGRTGNHPREVG
jgi:apolipoprotein N-acyltransferase